MAESYRKKKVKANWGSLPKELTSKIAEHVEFRKDFVALSCVCYSWRLAVKEAKFGACHRYHGLGAPWMMCREELNLPKHRSFYLLRDHSTHHVQIPPHLVPSTGVYTRLNEHGFLSSNGWLLSFSINIKLDKGLEKGLDSSIITPSLFSPIYGKCISLPELVQRNVGRRGAVKQLANYTSKFVKFALSGDPLTTKDFKIALMIVGGGRRTTIQTIVTYRHSHSHDWKLAADYGKPTFSDLDDVVFHQGKFYIVDTRGCVYSLEVGGKNDKYHNWNKVANFGKQGLFSWNFDELQPFYVRYDKRNFYLVESLGRLLLICRIKRFMANRNRYYSTAFEVFEVDLVNKSAQLLHNLQDEAVLIGFNSSFSVPATHPYGCKPNCIYYAEDLRYYEISDSEYEDPDTGIYDITTEKFERLVQYDKLSYVRGHSLPPHRSAMWLDTRS